MEDEGGRLGNKISKVCYLQIIETFSGGGRVLVENLGRKSLFVDKEGEASLEMDIEDVEVEVDDEDEDEVDEEDSSDELLMDVREA